MWILQEWKIENNYYKNWNVEQVVNYDKNSFKDGMAYAWHVCRLIFSICPEFVLLCRRVRTQVFSWIKIDTILYNILFLI